MQLLAQAQLQWNGKVPKSTRHHDIYFSADNPRAEVETVFIAANDLPRRFAQCRRFAIGETGFGSGLNFFLTLATWRRHAPAQSFLSYLSAEAYPMTPDDLRQTLRGQQIAEADIDVLLAQYPPPLSGLHRIEWARDRVSLTLVYGDAAPQLAQVQGQVDAWFLDGFAPRHNPELWNLAVFQQLARLSRSGTTLATFTAAGHVRRDLQAAGFTMTKQPGYGRKRERLTGYFSGQNENTKPSAVSPAATAALASTTGNSAGPIAVIGAGIAGLCVAQALRQRQVEVQIFDPLGGGHGASGNPAALLTPHLSAGLSNANHNALALAGMRATWALINRLSTTEQAQIILARGVEHHGITHHAARRLAALKAHDPALLGNLYQPLIGIEDDYPAVFYPAGLGINMGEYCRILSADMPLLPLSVQAVEADNTSARLKTTAGTQEFSAVIVATGASRPPLFSTLPTPTLVGGQMTCVAGTIPALRDHALTGQGYALPACANGHWLGATYRRDSPYRGLLPADDLANLRNLRWIDPGLAETGAARLCGSWYGERAVFRDRLPAVGPLTHATLSSNVSEASAPAMAPAMASAMAPAMGTAMAPSMPPVMTPAAAQAEAEHHISRVYLNLGFGSRGLLYAPLCGAWLADHICGLPEAISIKNSALFHPIRFMA